MINANELRIGNFIYRTSKMQPSDNILCTAAEILKEGVCIGYWQYAAHFAKDDEIKKHVVAYENLNPIPLTAEWLERFIKDNYTIFFYKPKNNKIFIQIDDLKIEIYNSELVNKKVLVRHNKTLISDIPKLQYVHQLQNLYFALTGKELEWQE